MLRGVRERFRLRRPKRSDVPPSTTFSTATTSTTATALTSPQLHSPHQSPRGGGPAPLPLPPSNGRPPLPHLHPHQQAHPPHRSHGAIPDVVPSDAQHYHHQNPYHPHQAPLLVAENTPANNAQPHVSASAGFKNDPLPQPRVFRNRSLEYGHRRDRQLLGLFAEKARRTFHRGKPAAMDDSMHHPQYAQHHPNHPYHYPSPQAGQAGPHLRTPQQIQQQQQYRHQFNHQQRDDALASMNNRRLAPSPLAQHHSSATAAPVLHGHGHSHPTGQQQSTAPPRQRNDDSFSSLPSTHASRDPFLNDDLPIEISQLDRPYGGRMRHNMQGHNDRNAGVGGFTAFDRNAKQSRSNQAHASNPSHRMFAVDGLSPAPPVPSSLASSITSRKRSTVWKRRYDPDAEFQSRHEREILKAVALSETAVKEGTVDAAQQLALIVDEQVSELDTVLADVDRQVKATRDTAQRLPSPTDIRFQQMLTPSVDINDQMTSAVPNSPAAPMSATVTTVGNDQDNKVSSSIVPVSSQVTRKNVTRVEDDMERTLLELGWKERVWDVDALIIEKQFEQAVNSVEALDGDGIAHQSSEVIELFQETIRVLVDELSACCARGRVENASSVAALLGKLGMADHARGLILRVAETELQAELGYIYCNSQDVTPRTATAMVSKTIMVLRHARMVFCDIEAHSMEVKLNWKFIPQQKDERLTKKRSSNKNSSSMFLAWAVVQCDRVFAEFIAPVIERIRKIDPVTILVNEQAVLGGSGADLDNDIGIGMDDLWNATSTSLLMLTKI